MFTGWTTVLIPWGTHRRASARIEVRGDFNGWALENVVIRDIDWIEIETVSGFKKGKVVSIDEDDTINAEFKAYFECMPQDVQEEYLEGAELYNADEYGITL